METVYFKRPDGGASAVHILPTAAAAMTWAAQNARILDEKDAISRRAVELQETQTRLFARQKELSRDAEEARSSEDDQVKAASAAALAALKSEQASQTEEVISLDARAKMLGAVEAVRDTMGFSEDDHADVLLARPEYQGWTRIAREEFDLIRAGK